MPIAEAHSGQITTPIQTSNANVLFSKADELKASDSGDPSLDERENSSNEQVSEPNATNSSEKSRRRSRYSLKQLSVQKVHPDGTVECQLVCKQKTISFKFNRFDTVPSDIIDGMIQEDCLRPGSHKLLMEQLQDVITQLQQNPTKVPECSKYVQKVCTEPAWRSAYASLYRLFDSSIDIDDSIGLKVINATFLCV